MPTQRLLNPLVVLLVYLAAVVGISFFIVHNRTNESPLMVIAFPLFLCAYYYPRRVYLVFLGIFSAATLTVIVSVHGVWNTYTLIALLASISTGASMEIIHAIVQQRRKALETAAESLRLADALRETAATITRNLDLDSVLEAVIKNVGKVVPHDAANIILVDEDTLQSTIARAIGYEHKGNNFAISNVVMKMKTVPSFRHMRQTRLPLLIPDTHNSPYWQVFPDTAWIHAYLGCPIISKERLLGFLNLDSATPGFFKPSQADALRAFADQTAIAIENARLYTSLQRELEERRQAEEALRKSETLMRTIIDNLPFDIWGMDTQHRTMLQNRFSAQFWGENLGMEYDTSALSPETVAHWEENNRRAFAGEIVSGEYSLIYQGRQYDFLEILSPIRQDETIIGIVGINIDITERKRLETQMIQSQKLAELGTLAAGMAHELNSPLQVITGISERLVRSLGEGNCEPEYFKRNLQMINRNGWRCAEIVRSLLMFARSAPISFQAADLNALVRDALLLIEHQLERWNRIEVITELAENLPPLQCDANRISQVLINLLTNARDAMPNGGTLTIRTMHRPHRREVVLQVQDTGQGIPEEIRSQIFTPFFTTKPLGEGTGLGLSIVLGIVHQHGGRIEVDSTPNQGTLFTLTFPEDFLPPPAPAVEV